MALLGIGEIDAGMVLADDLRSPNGRMILPKGSVIQDKHLRIFKTWGVTEADIEGVSREEAQAQAQAQARISPENLQNAEAYVHRFLPSAMQGQDEDNGGDAPHPMSEIRRVMVLRVARMMEDGHEAPSPASPPPLGKLQAADKIGPEEMAARETELVSFPDIYLRLREVIESPRTSAANIAEVVSADTGLTARLLKLVNSPFYGFPSRIDSIARAATLIGATELSSLALGVSAVQAFDKVPEGLLTMEDFWRHSISCGVFVRLLASHIQGLPLEPFFVAGLLHDVGRLVMLRRSPRQSAKAMLLAMENRQSQYEAERSIFGYDHALVGGILLDKWNFPESLTTMVKKHHDPDRENIETCLVHVANTLAGASFLGRRKPLPIPAIERSAWERLGLSPNVLAPAVDQAMRQVGEIMNVFNRR